MSYKKRDLEKKLGKLGWCFDRAGGRHDIWTNGKITEEIPRHSTITKGLYLKILKKAKLFPGE